MDTAARKVDRRATGVASNLRALALSADGSELYVAATDGDPEPVQSDPNARPFVHQVVVMGADPNRAGYGEVLRRVDLTRQEGSPAPLVNPAGIMASGETLWVSSESSSVVAALDRMTLREKARVPVGMGARQLLALDGAKVAVHAYQSLELWILGSDGKVESTIKLADDARPADVALGEAVFYRPGGNFARNHACASCHVETQNDGMVWRFGPMLWHNVRPLQLLDGTRPLEWGAYVTNPENFGYQGPGSIVSRPATPEEAQGMTAFLGSLLGAPRATGYTRLDGSYTADGLRGKALFEGKAGCVGCHAPPLYTNRQYIPKGKSNVPADVPTLLGVYRHGVYFVNGQSRRLEDAVDVAIKYVGTTLTVEERADLTEFLRELTPKGGAPLGMFPDNDSNEAVHSDIRPWAAFADAIDDTNGRSAEAVASEYVTLETDMGAKVPGKVSVTGGRIEYAPDMPLAAGGRYRFRVRAGLPFRDGGALWADRTGEFTVASAPAAALPDKLRMTITVTGPMGMKSQLPVLLTAEPARPGGLRYVLQPLAFGTQQRQPLWVRIDGDRVLVQPFALALSPGGGVGDLNRVVGTIKTIEGGKATRVEGTLRITGPGIEIPNIPFEMVPM